MGFICTNDVSDPIIHHYSDYGEEVQVIQNRCEPVDTGSTFITRILGSSTPIRKPVDREHCKNFRCINGQDFMVEGNHLKKLVDHANSHGDSQGTEQSTCVREMNGGKEKPMKGSVLNGNSPEPLQSRSHPTVRVSVGPRRSNRAKSAPVALVIPKGNSKSYSSPLTTSVSRSTEAVKSTVKKIRLQRSTKKHRIEEALALRDSHQLKITQTAVDSQTLSQASSEDDRVSLVSSSTNPSTIVTRFKRSQSPNTIAEIVKQKRAKGAADLDEPTMKAIKEFLSLHKFDSLDDDEVIEETLSINKAANEKTRSFQSEQRSRDDEPIFEQCLQHEETHAIGQDFLREIVAAIGLTAAGPAKKTSTTNVDTSDINKVLVDQRTIGWIRRATGLHRQTSNNELTHRYSSIRQDPTLATPSRVATRGLVNGGGTTGINIEKRNNRLDVMADAIAELEKDFGTHFPVYRFRSSPPKKKKSRRSHDNAKKRKKAEGKQQLSIRKKTRHIKVKKPSPRICTALRVLDEAWRFQTKPNELVRRTTETEKEYLSRRSIPLHPQFVKAGIVHRLPTMHSLLKNHEFNVLTKSIAPLPKPFPTGKNDDFDSLTSLEGAPAKFAKYEFFYSDLDKEWYKENIVASTLGLPLDAPFSHDEWKSIRRRCKLVPRRFSKQFIASELMERNKYRRIIRSVQSNPYMRPPTFRYNVYKPLHPETLVKAYCKKCQTIQNGIVVSYEPTCARYLIEFEEERYGHEYCPDSDVASYGKPRVLFRGYVDDCHDRSENSIGELQDAQLGSPTTIQQIEFMLEQSMIGTSKLFEPDNDTLSALSKKMLEEAANDDAFLTLMEVIDTIGMRKSDILSLISDANTLAVNFLPFGEEEEQNEESTSIMSDETKDYLQWLHYNLRRTNDILVRATDYFQTLYGDSFSLTDSKTRSEERTE